MNEGVHAGEKRGALLGLREAAHEEVVFFSSRRRHTRYWRDWSSDVCSSDLIRIRRGTIPVEWEGGTVYVLLDAPAEGRTTGDQTDDPIELISELRDRISSLERQMDEERESRRRTDTIIVQLTQANTALTDRLRELEAPSQTIEGRLYEPAEAAVEPAPGANEEPSERPTEPRALRSRWATWRAPSRLVAVIAWVLPLVVTAIGVFYVTLTTLNNQTISAVVGTISWALALAVSLYLNAALRRWQGREDELERALEEFGERMSAVGYKDRKSVV